MDVPEVDPEAAAAMRDRGAAWVDVREPSEWAAARIPDTELIPMSEAVAAIPSRYPDRATPLVLSCHSGARSGQLVAYLRRLGYTDVHNLRGGIVAWYAAGRPIEQG